MTTVPPPGPGAPPPAQKSGCWKWGALGCLAVIILGAIVIGAVVMIAFGAMKSSDVYKQALARAQNNPRVIAALGSPVTAGFFVTGSVNVSGGTGNAEISFPIRGPKGKGNVHGVATRDSSGWHFTELMVVTGNGHINLLESP